MSGRQFCTPPIRTQLQYGKEWSPNASRAPRDAALPNPLVMHMQHVTTHAKFIHLVGLSLQRAVDEAAAVEEAVQLVFGCGEVVQLSQLPTATRTATATTTTTTTRAD
jgi:hypothetical protein